MLVLGATNACLALPRNSETDSCQTFDVVDKEKGWSDVLMSIRHGVLESARRFQGQTAQCF